MTIHVPDDADIDPDAPLAVASRELAILGPGGGLASSPLQIGGDFVFIDSRVPDIQDLINGVNAGDRVFVIDADRDGLAQIAGILAASNAQDIASISIVSHGSVGELEIGSTILNDATLSAHADALSAIGAALKAGGDVQLFSCNTAQGAAGQQFIGDLSSFLGGADVVASTHIVGSASAGGSFLLDSATGAVDVVSPFTGQATGSFDGTLSGTVSGQLWYGMNGSQGVSGSIDAVGHVNSDATSPTTQGTEDDAGEVQPKSVGVDTAAGFYFQTNDSTALTISSYNYTTGNIVGTNGTVIIGNTGQGDIVNALAVDQLHDTIYVGRWGIDLAHSGIIKLTYNPSTGALDPTAAFNSSPNFIVSGNAGVDDIRGIAVDPVNQVIYFTVSNDTYNTAPFSYTNGLWRVNQDGTGLTQMTTSAQFPASISTSQQKAIGPVAYDAAKGLVYFETSDIHTGGTGAATLWAIASNASGGTATQVTLPGGTVLAYGDSPQGGLSIDNLNQQIYIVTQSGTSAGAADEVLVGQLAANGLSITSIVNTYSYATLNGHANNGADHITGAMFNQLPVLTIAGNSTAAVEQSTSILTLNSESSSDDSNYSGATVQITGGTFSSNESSSSDDHLTINGATTGTVSGTNITLSYNSATETLTLSGYDTAAHYDAALALVKYNTTGDNPTNYGSNSARTVTWTINDGSLNIPGAQQNTGTTTLNITGVNDASVLATGATTSYSEQAAATVIDSSITVSDVDNLNQASASVVISAGFQTGDVLAANTTGTSITASYSAATHTLTLSGSDTLAHYQQVLRTVTFQNSTNDDPTAGGTATSRTIAFTTNDGTVDSNTINATVNVTAVNDAPTASAPGTHYGATTSVTLDLKNTGLSVADVDGGSGSETLTLTVGDGVLNGTAGTSGAGVSGSGTATLTITGTVAQVNAFLNTDGSSTISFFDNNGTPPASTTLSLSINDNGNTGGGSLIGTASATIDITSSPGNDPPVITVPGTNYAATEQVSLNLKASGISVSDIDGGTGSETLTISVGEGTLTATAGTSGAGISGNGTGTLTLTGTIAQLNAFLNTDGTSSFSYADNNDTPSASTTLSLNLNDNGNTGTGGAQQDNKSIGIDITAVNDAPIAVAPGTHYAATEQTTLDLKNTGLSVSDVDNGGGGETLTISVGEGTLTATTGTSGVSVSGSGTGTITIGGTIAQINAFLATDGTSTFSYIDNTDAPSASTTLSLSLNDNGNAGSGGSQIGSASSTIDITAVNDAPVLAGAGSTLAYTEGGAAVTLEPALTVGDVDSANLVGATISLSGFFTGDELKINGATTGDIINGGNTIHFSYNGATGTLSLSGSDTVADYQAALRLVAYDSTSLNPTNYGALTSRDVGWTVDDGSASNNNSAPVDTTINITAVDSPAVAADDNLTTDESTAIGAGLNLFNDNGHGIDFDPDNTSISIASVAGGPGANVGTQFTLTSGALLTVNADGTFAYDPNHAFDSLHLAAPGSGAANTQAIDTFSYTLANGGSATVTVTVQGVDNANTIYEGTAGNDAITGGPGGHLFDLSQGGDDVATGGSGNDSFKFLDTFDSNDHVDGGGGTNDQIGLQGDYSGGLTLSGSFVQNVEVLALLPGFDYNIATDGTLTTAGQTFTVWSVTMASGNHDTLDFHQEAGNIVFYLGQGNDTASGGSGNDLFYGEGGADALTGNGGSDTFAFLSAADSNGAGGTGYDVLDFTAGIDKIKLADGTAVNVIDAAVSGTLSSASFDSDLSAVLGNGQLHELDQGHAVVFTANAGTLNAHVFLIVGTAAAATGYTAGNDYVFDVTAGSNFGALATTDFI